MESVEFKVLKMGCSSCVAKVTRALSGVTSLEVVSVTPGHAVVRRDPALVNDEQVIAALKAAGYEATREVRHVTANSDAGSSCHV